MEELLEQVIKLDSVIPLNPNDSRTYNGVGLTRVIIDLKDVDQDILLIQDFNGDPALQIIRKGIFEKPYHFVMGSTPIKNFFEHISESTKELFILELEEYILKAI